MMRFIGNVIGLTYANGEPIATFRLSDETFLETAEELISKDETYVIELKKYRQKRSLDANGYFWALCNQIAERLNVTKEEVYKHEIKEVGVCQALTLHNENIEDALKSFDLAWKMNGLGWFTEVADIYGDTATLIAYFGSSTYDTKQMSRLIDNVVEECKVLNISTLTPSEIALLKEEWN